MIYKFSYQTPTCNCSQGNGACSFCYQNAIYPHITHSELICKTSATLPVTDMQNIVLNDIMNMAIKINIDNLDIHRSNYSIRAEFVSLDADEVGRLYLSISLLPETITISSPYRNNSQHFDYVNYEKFLFSAVESVNNIKHLQKTKLF